MGVVTFSNLAQVDVSLTANVEASDFKVRFNPLHASDCYDSIPAFIYIYDLLTKALNKYIL